MNVRCPQKLGPAALVLAMLAGLACGGEDAPTEPDNGDGNNPPPAADYEGYAVYAVDLDNNLLLFGSASATKVSKIMKISGLPILNRIVGIDFRPSTGELYGVGNDSRVYILDPETAAATAVSATQFTPIIAAAFDIHFAMGFEPGTERIRLISADFGGNWSIDPDDGTAVRGQDVHYAAGEPNEGQMPEILGLAYVPPNAGAAGRLAAGSLCLVGVDALVASLIGTCDPDEAAFVLLEQLEGIQNLIKCGEVKYDPEGNLFASLIDGAERLNKWLTVDDETGETTDLGDIPDDSEIQGIAFDPNAPVRSGSAIASAAAPLALAPSGSGGRLSCTGAS